MKITSLNTLLAAAILVALVGCSTPEEKAQKYLDKGMELLDSDPAKAKLEFQNALQLNKKMAPAIYGLALAAEKQADWQACFNLLNKVIEEDPKHIDAIVKLGQLFLAAGELEKAKQNAEKATAINKENLNAMVLQASIDLKEKKYPEAVEKAKHVLTLNKDNTDAVMILASERYAANDIKATLKYLDQGLTINDKNLVMHLFKLQVLEAYQSLEETEQAYRNVISIFPKNYALRANLAKYYHKKNKQQKAEDELRVLAKEESEKIEPKLNLIRYLGVTKGEQAAKSELQRMVKEDPNNFELAFHLVELFEYQKEMDSADALLAVIIKNAGDKPEGLKAKVRVASKLLQTNQKQKAINLIDEVLAIDGGFQEAILLKANVAIQEQRYDDAIIELRSALRDQPNNSQAHFLMAKTYELTGSVVLAEESYGKAMASSKNAPEYGNAFARYLMARQEADRAEKVLEETFKTSPSNIETIGLLAQVKIFKGDFNAAKALAERAGKLSDTNLSYLIEGGILAKNNDYAGSVAAFMKAHELNPYDMQTILAIVRVHLSKKNYKEAMAFVDGLVTKYPKNHEFKLVLGQVAMASGNTDKAKLSFQTAIESMPKQISAYQQLANLYVMKGDIKAAREVVNKGLANINNSFDLEMLSAELYQYENKQKDALDVYEKLMRSHPNSQVALNNYVSVVADAEMDKVKLKEAYMLAQGLKESKVPEFLDSLAWISYRVGKYDEAEAKLLNAIKINPNIGIFYYHLAKVNLAKGDKLSAKDNLERSLEFADNGGASYKAEVKELLKTV